MEDTGRPFESIKIDMASVETGHERFPSEEQPSRPIPAFWRLNLTALSQKFNLYFIAIGRYIHVYEPQFPFQKLESRQKLTIIPQLANPSAPGYIDVSRPHVVNNLIVGQLGEQEVLLLSTDSGNVSGYETRTIFNAIQRYAANPLIGSTTLAHTDLRPFFAQWVVESAWGLSIHTKGRMIAVSANVSPRYVVDSVHGAEDEATITVFAFALTSSHSDSASEDSVNSSSNSPDIDEEWRTWNPIFAGRAFSYPPRHKNYRITLAGPSGHDTNIPCVSFFNNAEDPFGSWLLSTDIDENVKLWHIWSGLCVYTWELRDREVGGAAWLADVERGWIAVPLDRRAFQPVSDLESLIGHHHAPPHYAYGARGNSFNITNIVRYHVPSNCLSHPLNDSESDGDSPEDEERIQMNEDLSESGSLVDDADLDRAQRIRSELGLEMPSLTNMPDTPQATHSSHEPQIQSRVSARGIDMVENLADESSFEEEDFDVESDFSEDDASGFETHNRTSSNLDNMRSRSADHTGSGPMHDAPNYHPYSSPGTRPRMEEMQTSSGKLAEHKATTVQHHRPTIPATPFIYCSTSHLRLFDGSHARYPHLFSARFLKQSMSAVMEDHDLVQMDRLDMIEQIPEIGVVIIATQIGRCAICTLTKRRTDGLVGLRVDWILPAQRQERAGKRPNTSLHGIAVSPVPRRCSTRSEGNVNGNAEYWTRDRKVGGVFTTFDKTTLDISDAKQHVLPDARKPVATTSTPLPSKAYDWSQQQSPESWDVVDGKKRYRLMMTYADMTVLTYEISRGVERHDIRVD